MAESRVNGGRGGRVTISLFAFDSPTRWSLTGISLMYFVITSFHLVRRQPTARPQDFAMLPMG
jgi:hypothetical protein